MKFYWNMYSFLVKHKTKNKFSFSKEISKAIICYLWLFSLPVFVKNESQQQGHHLVRIWKYLKDCSKSAFQRPESTLLLRRQGLKTRFPHRRPPAFSYWIWKPWSIRWLSLVHRNGRVCRSTSRGGLCRRLDWSQALQRQFVRSCRRLRKSLLQ